ncbi:TonB-dependent receptor [Sandaracinobacteroides saxicola]|uniref:TonB-dependent receptor n=1 Tax=Sandaracinobacteroides saxicola TaxID=2759707 RepID=A0A7G5IL87_9SPHN|nr:TonB-dependent receptor [Sandaracinobacteroides saxicola]QMW24129.1 TonB-dependent receptor [Sandaracinobacteroides saxicola]
MTNRALLRALTSLGAVAIAMPLWAQTPATPPAAAAAAEDVPADIVVTAQKRTERLQDVPVAVSVVSGDTIARQGGISIESAQYLVPALNFRKSGTSLNQSLFLRGVGTINFSIAAEPSVATVLDGVVLARAGEAFGDLVEIERIEVLRGPQGTLFGKNASAGVVNIVSKRPTDRLEGYVELGFFTKAEYRARATLNIPFSPAVRGRFTGFWSKYDGNYLNIAPTVNGVANPNGTRVNGYDRYGFRGVIEADAGDALKLTLIGDWRKADDNCCAESLGTTPSNLAAGLFPSSSFAGNNSRLVSQDLITATKEKSWGLSLQADLDVGDAGTVTSITSYRKWDNREIRDGDWLPAAYVGLNQLHDDGPQKSSTFSQELRLASPGGQTVEYVVGGFYSRAKADRVFTRSAIGCSITPAPSVLTPCTAPGVTVRTASGTATFGSVFENVAAFGQATWNVTDALRIIAGLRYTHDKLSVYHSRTTTGLPTDANGIPQAFGGINPNFDQGVFATAVLPGNGNPLASNGVPFRANTSNDNLSGRLGAQFDLTEDNTAYATWSRGYKGPAFNTFFGLNANGTNVIEPESADAFEVGLKNTLFDGRLVLNIAAFYAKYRNYQANNPDLVAGVVVTRLTNAGTVSTRGVEADFIARFGADTTISGGLSYADARVDRFKLPVGGNVSAVIPNGTPLANAPKFKGSLSINHRVVTGGQLDLELGSNLSVQSQQLSQFNENALVRQITTINPYALVDLQAGLVDRDDRFRLTLYVRNLMNQSFAAAIQNGGPGGSFRYIVPREAERYFGATLRVNFGK